MNHFSDQLQTQRLLTKYISQQKKHEQFEKIVLSLISLLDNGDKDETVHVVQMLESFGKAATADLKQLKYDGVHLQKKKEQYELNLKRASQEVEEPQAKPSLKELGDLFSFKQKPLLEDDSVEQFKSLLVQCQRLKLSTSKNQKRENIEHLLQTEDRLMEKLRRHKALCSIGLSQPASDEDSWNSQLHTLFKDTYLLISYLEPEEISTLFKLQALTCPWVWEEGPPACVLSSSSLENLSLRVYGLELNCRDAKVSLTQDDNGYLESKQEIQLQRNSDQNEGILLHLSKICLNDFEGIRKTRGDAGVKFYRVACKIPVTLATLHDYGSLHCQFSSLPFTVRTGSTQLWPYISAVVWSIWAQEDIRKPVSECPTVLEISSVLGMIQARIIGAGLRLSNEALWNSYACHGKTPSSLPPHKLTDGERKGWTDILKKRCAINSTNELEPLISRAKFIRKPPEVPCIWTLVCAAVNTGLRLKKYNLDRFFHIGLSKEICQLLPARVMEIGNFFLRSSLSKVEHDQGQEPVTDVVIELCPTRKIVPRRLPVETLDTWTLLKNMMQIKFGEEQRHVWHILPTFEDLRLIEEGERSKLKVSGYTGSDHEEFPPGVCFKLESLDLSEDISESSPAGPSLSSDKKIKELEEDVQVAQNPPPGVAQMETDFIEHSQNVAQDTATSLSFRQQSQMETDNTADPLSNDSDRSFDSVMEIFRSDLGFIPPKQTADCNFLY